VTALISETDLRVLEDFLRPFLDFRSDATLSATLLEGGRSNLTYQISAGAESWILRRPPLGATAGAHDMLREFRMLSALGGTSVPVPRALVCADGDSPLGVPFLVMSFEEGTVYTRRAQLEELGLARTCAIGRRMVNALADLHRVDPAAVGLDDFGRPKGFTKRQVRRWTSRAQTSSFGEHPAARAIVKALTSWHPQPAGTHVVHGDFRLDNLLVNGRGRIQAVIDWELATLGCPLTDVAMLAVHQRLAALGPGMAITDATTALGFPGPDQVLDLYASASGRNLPDIGLHQALAALKLAGVLDEIRARHDRRQTRGEGFDDVGSAIVPLLEIGLALITEDG
jgi:aminoglycoside phosphotransferase (APT) family kinase protein